ncbi:MAG: Protein tas [Phycisphaerae bacterium]|nr:Protein tas [Phycisphaerae bacterium]
MKQVNLGRTGLKVSDVCLGTMTLGREADAATSEAILDCAFERGITFYDTANSYSAGASERVLGAWLAKRGLRRQIVLATKVRSRMDDRPNEVGLSRRTIMQHCEDSLSRLGTDWIDLYQCHSFDDSTPLEETLRALDDLVRQGKVRYVGCSNFAAWQVAKGLWISDRLGLEKFVCLQPMYNLLKRSPEAELLPLCLDQGIGVIPYNPLAGGFLTGKYSRDRIPDKTRLADNDMYRKRFLSQRNFEILDRFLAEAERRGVSPAALSLAWVRAHPAVTAPIVGARTVEQLKDSLAGAEMELTPDDRESISRLSEFEWEGNLGR